MRYMYINKQKVHSSVCIYNEEKKMLKKIVNLYRYKQVRW